MDKHVHDIIETARNTEIMRYPGKVLSTFGTTRIHYYLLTEPVYKEIISDSEDTVVREGYIIAEKPRIITPSYLKNTFQGFEHGDIYTQSIIDTFGAFEPGILYNYRNDFKELTVVTAPMDEVFQRLSQDLNNEDDTYATIIRGDKRLWDLSLMIFIYSFTANSSKRNISDLDSLGLLDVDRSGVSREGRLHIESLFREVQSGNTDPSALKVELDAWGVFGEFEDRFLNLFKKKD